MEEENGELITRREGSSAACVCAVVTFEPEASMASVLAPNRASDWEQHTGSAQYLTRGQRGARAAHLCKDTATAPDIEHVLPVEPPRPLELLHTEQFALEELDPGRVHPVQEAKFARRIPPVRRQARKVGNLVGRDRVGRTLGIGARRASRRHAAR